MEKEIKLPEFDYLFYRGSIIAFLITHFINKRDWDEEMPIISKVLTQYGIRTNTLKKLKHLADEENEIMALGGNLIIAYEEAHLALPYNLQEIDKMLKDYAIRKKDLNQVILHEPLLDMRDKPNKLKMTLLSHLSDIQEMDKPDITRLNFIKHLIIKYFDRDIWHDADQDYAQFIQQKQFNELMNPQNKNNGKTEN